MSSFSSVQQHLTDTIYPETNSEVLLSTLFNKYIHFNPTVTQSSILISISNNLNKSLLYSFITLFASYLFIYHFTKTSSNNKKRGPSIFQSIMNKFSEALSLPSMFSQSNYNNNNNNGYGRFGYGNNNPEFKRKYKIAMKNGGFPGGLANDGNTCFMNSVIQCLASSKELKDFLSSFTRELANENQSNNNSSNNENENEDKNNKKINSFLHSFKSNSNDQLKHVQFSSALLDLIESLNAEHGNRSPTYKTKDLLRVMKDSPNKHLFLGYNQEDAQEFYQNLMKQVEKEYTDLEKNQNIEIVIDNNENEKNSNSADNKCEEKISDKYVSLPENSITGLDDLGYLGNVYVPVSQIDPADDINENKFLPFKLITPVDGLQCDRIGCVNCGETGGIRYSVTSGLALNLPSEGANRNRFTLGELIDEFCKPDVIDGVECNRCSLVAIKENLIERLDNLQESENDLKGSKLLIEKIQQPLSEIDNVLSKKCIHDDIYKKLHTKNMVQKSRKVKQSYLSRPPALLCIHINRSVFDPRTYMVRKNNAKIDFPLELDLKDFVASVDDINSDARLQFRKQDEDGKKIDRGNLLKYNLKSVISHFGTHNYGHYIAFRKHKGNWWHLSDEIVRLSSEEEVLGSQGTFMLFYEISNAGDEDIDENIDEDDENDDGYDHDHSDSNSDSDSDSESESNSEGHNTDNNNKALSSDDISSGISNIVDDSVKINDDNESLEMDIESESENQERIANIQANL